MKIKRQSIIDVCIYCISNIQSLKIKIYLNQLYHNNNGHQSKDALLAVEQNNLRYLDIGTRISGSLFKSTDSDDYDRLGTAVGNNTILKELRIDNFSNNVTLNAANERFYDGIRRNSSITTLYLNAITYKRDITDVALEVLRAACQEKDILTKLHINTMPLASSAELYRFVGSLRGFANLREITYIHSRITDDQLLPMVETIRGHNLIEELSLFGNRIENVGCEALATLRNITKVNLSDNRIGNEGMISFVNSLAENKNLRELFIYQGNPFNLRNVEGYFSRALCNISSINDIYLSNHTLERIYIEQVKGAKLRSLLEMNKKTNKRHVAIEKILLYHPPIDMEPLFDLSLEEDDSGQDLKALPHVISWFETAEEAITEDVPRAHFNLDGRKLPAIYQFVTAMPMLFAPASHNKGVDKKRKRSDS